MMHILLNQTNFDQDWANPYLLDIIQPEMKVAILPLSRNEGWASDVDDWTNRFEEDSEYREDITRPLLRYGIKKKDISILNHYVNDESFITKTINEADILVLIGEDALEARNCLMDLPLVYEAIQTYPKTIISIGEASLVLFDSFVVEGETYEGLDRISGIDCCMNYNQTKVDLEKVLYSLEMRGRNVILLTNQSGFLLGDDTYELFGQGSVATTDDLDEYYTRYQYECN